jgi:alanine racemase
MQTAPATVATHGTVRFRPTLAEVDLAAIRHNVQLLAAVAAPARLCAVVKADGYGHGAVPVARAALEAGASWLAVAMVEEGVLLREAGIAGPVLILSEPPPGAMAEVAARSLTPTLYTLQGVRAAAQAAAHCPEPMPVHVKVDSGMHRVGVAGDALLAVAREVLQAPALHLQGLFTHLATAEEEDSSYAERQLQRFAEARRLLAEAGVRPPIVHAANSAGLLCPLTVGLDMVRCGISLYGYAPGPLLRDRLDLRPALTLRSQVAFVKRVPAGEAISYGQHYRLAADSIIATVPIGYADGVPRNLSALGGQVLLGGVRRPLAGAVTMDQITVDCGPESGATVQIGDEVVLLGCQGTERISADDWADATGTISYEILTGIGGRVPREYRGTDQAD